MRRNARIRAGAVGMAAALALALFVGCAKKDQTAGGDTTNVAEKLGEAAGEVSDSAESLGVRVTHTISETKRRAEQGKELVEIRGALVADAALGAASIDVSVDEPTKTITLTGTVESAADKRSAERIAREKAPDYTIRNEIRVRTR